ASGAAREVPHAGEEASLAPNEEGAPAALYEGGRDGDAPHLRLRRAPRKRPGPPQPSRRAQLDERAAAAFRSGRGADRLTEIHHSRGQIPRPSRREKTSA